jgi:hypothetical protein
MAARKQKAAATFKNRIVETSVVAPDELLAHPDNWRIHPDHQRQVMAGALRDLGWIQHVTVSKRTKTILDGHLRVFLAKAQGEVVPVAWVDLSEEEERKALGSIDTLTQLADVDFEAVVRNLSGINNEGTDQELAALFDDAESEARDAIGTKERMDVEGNSNFGSIKKTFRERKIVIKAIYALEDAELIERALEATGKINRAEAIKVLAKEYLDMRGEIIDVENQDTLGLELMQIESDEKEAEAA